MKQVRGYYVNASTSERRTGRVRGPFKDRRLAEIECTDQGPGKGPGWCGANDGSVEVVDFFEDVQGNIYEAGPQLKFVDVESKYKADKFKEIKSKLSAEEWRFINENISNG